MLTLCIALLSKNSGLQNSTQVKFHFYNIPLHWPPPHPPAPPFVKIMFNNTWDTTQRLIYIT